MSSRKKWVFAYLHTKYCKSLNTITAERIFTSVNINLNTRLLIILHDILLLKLSMYGLHNNALEWFKSYLNLITQKTFISGEQSTPGKGFWPRPDTIFDMHQ